MRSKVVAAMSGCALVASVLITTQTPAAAQPQQNLFAQQESAHRLYDSLPRDLVAQLSGHWFNRETGKLTVAVTSEQVAAQAKALGADATVVARSQVELDQIMATVRELVGSGRPGRQDRLGTTAAGRHHFRPGTRGGRAARATARSASGSRIPSAPSTS